MNINNKKNYNNQEYDVTLLLYDSNITLTSPGSIETDNKKAVIIPTEEITYIMIENSIIDIIPKAEFEIVDNRIFINIKIKKGKYKI